MINYNRKKYKIMLEPNSIFVLLGLFVISSALVFYLGLSFGKAERMIIDNKLTISETTSNGNTNKLAVLNINENKKSVKEYIKKLDLIDKSVNLPKNILDIKKTNNIAEQENNDVINNKSEINDPSKTKYTIQLAMMNNSLNADQLLVKLRQENYDAYILAVPNENGQIEYRVRVGSGLEKKELDNLLKKLTAQYAGLTVPSVHEYGKL